jgi:superfamily I DNA/RNA helicase
MDEPDHLKILACLKELPYSVGKGTLAEILSGAVTKKMLMNSIYMELKSYSSLSEHPQAHIEQSIDRLLMNGLLAATSLSGQPHVRVLKITPKGLQELRRPSMMQHRFTTKFKADIIDAQSKMLMEQFSFFLTAYNNEQQHAIVSPAKRILCVAGAGTGKTTVLTKRIEFLVRYRGVDPKDILAITFTRKARAEMQSRLAGIGAHVTTFNGFCEQLLRAHKQTKPIINYGQKIRLFHDALAAESLHIGGLVLDYFTDGQRKGATRDELEKRLMGDVYSIIEHYSNEDEIMPAKGKSTLASTLLGIARRIDESIEAQGLRDYPGQLRDALALLRSSPGTRPHYTHILVDEYQDVNIAQQRLIELLNAEHLFVVGDPRQSVFGWRGSQIRFISEFAAETTIQLRTNYRSRTEIVALMNRLIARMGLPDLEGQGTGGVVQTLKYANEDEEVAAIALLLAHMKEKDVCGSASPGMLGTAFPSIFVLARTNRQLQDLSILLKQRGIAHNIRREEDESEPTGIVLATVHAIKGLEASTVIVLGATSRYFPCKVSDHPVVDLIKDSYLDREEEERRLLYVAVSRAKERLIITYTSIPTYFLDGALESPGSAQKSTASHKRTPSGDAAFERLQNWRAQLAKQRGVPAYVICTDRTLQELTETRPQSLRELKGIHGLGEMRIKQFGEEILRLLQ